MTSEQMGKPGNSVPGGDTTTRRGLRGAALPMLALVFLVVMILAAPVAWRRVFREVPVETLADDCSVVECKFVGVDVANQVVTDGSKEGGDWNGWSDWAREQVDRAGVERWNPCGGDQLTVTVIGRVPDNPLLPPIQTVVARWSNGTVKCVGEFVITGTDFPVITLGGSMEPDSALVVAVPDAGATILAG